MVGVTCSLNVFFVFPYRSRRVCHIVVCWAYGPGMNDGGSNRHDHGRQALNSTQFS
jgi:hypothetical protein